MSHALLAREDMQWMVEGQGLMMMMKPQSSAGRTKASSAKRRHQHILEPLWRNHPEAALRIIFFFLGIGILLPWNAFINAKDYFETRMCQANVESSFMFVYTCSMVVTMTVTLVGQWSLSSNHHRSVGKSTPQHSNSNKVLHTMVRLPLSVTLSAFLLQSLLVALPSNIVSAEQMQWYAWASLVSTGLGNSLWSAGCVALAGPFPAGTAMNPHLEGQAIAGIVVSLANLMAAIVSQDPDDFWQSNCVEQSAPRGLLEESSACPAYDTIDWGVLGFFLLGALLLFLCWIGISCIEPIQQQLQQQKQDETVQLLIPDATSLLSAEKPSRYNSTLVRQASTATTVVEASPGSSLASHQQAAQQDDFWNVIRSIASPAHTIYVTFVITIAIFPVWTSALVSVHKCADSDQRIFNDLFMPLSFVWFNVADWSGRMLVSSWPRLYEWMASRLDGLAWARLLFIMLLLACPTNNDTYHWHSDWFTIVTQIGFAMSHGMLLSVSFAHAPTLVSEDSMKVMSEVLMLSLALGLLTGSITSFGVANLLGM